MKSRVSIAIIQFFVSMIMCSPSLMAEEVQLIKEGGVYHLPVRINEAIELNFVVDTGASDVHIPADVVLTLMRAGTISVSDFRGKDSYQMADGSVKEYSKFTLRSLKIGSQTIRNIKASAGPINGTLLLGQSALEKLEPWRMDTNRGLFAFNEDASTNQHTGKIRKEFNETTRIQELRGRFENVKWKKWVEWDKVTQSYVSIDGTLENKSDVQVALEILNPDLPPFLLVSRTASSWCGSRGCTLEVLEPGKKSSGKMYKFFQAFLGDDIKIRKDKTINGWYPIMLNNNVLIYKNNGYDLP
jgi:hypothetical protein